VSVIDVDRLRADTPGVANVLHFNNAGAGLMPTPVLAAQQAHLTREAEIGGYEAVDEAAERLDAVYASVAQLVGARPREIALVESATRAWGAAFHAFHWQDGDRIVTSEAEYASNYIAFLQLQKRTRIDIAVARSDGAGQTDPADIERLIDGRTKLVSMVHVPTNGGLVNPVAEIGAIARAHGVPYLVDACQSAGQIDLDVGAIGCDLLSVTGRKYLRGPRGTGFLYVGADILDRLDPPFLDMFGADWVAPGRYEMRDSALRFENFESHVAGRLGLGVAVDYALAIGMPEIEDRVAALGEALRSALSALPQVTVTDIGAIRCGIVTFAHDSLSPGEIKDRLRAQNINTSVTTDTSTLLDMQRRGHSNLVRASVHCYNTEEEIERFCGAVAALSPA
jgi:selenocysteine lyase/cysteine desulfurase